MSLEEFLEQVKDIREYKRAQAGETGSVMLPQKAYGSGVVGKRELCEQMAGAV